MIDSSGCDCLLLSDVLGFVVGKRAASQTNEWLGGQCFGPTTDAAQLVLIVERIDVATHSRFRSASQRT
jgi:hypothetical protein